MKGVIRSEREGSAGVVRGTLSVILNECEGSITVVRETVRCYSTLKKPLPLQGTVLCFQSGQVIAAILSIA